MLESLASLWEELAQPTCTQEAKLCTEVTVHNFHAEPTKCHKADPCRVVCFLRGMSSNTFEDQSSSVLEQGA